MEELPEKSIQTLLPPEVASVKKVPPPPLALVIAPAKQRGPRRPSASTPVIRRNDSVSAGGDRLKREIHPPPSEGLWCDISKGSRAAKGNLNAEQLRFCSELVERAPPEPALDYCEPIL